MKFFILKIIGIIRRLLIFSYPIINFIEKKQNFGMIHNQYDGLIYNGYSFIIVSGKKSNYLVKSVESILKVFKDEENYEIIIVTENKHKINTFKNIKIKFFHFKSFVSNNRLFSVIFSYNISLKKNIGALRSKYSNLIFMHDYVSIDSNWLKGFRKFGNEFEVCTNKILNFNNQRHRDWVIYGHPFLGSGLLPYDKNCNKYQYLNGSYFVVKREFFLHNPLKNALRWGQGEDVEWSRRVTAKTNIQLNPYSSVRYLKQRSENDPPYNLGWIKDTLLISNYYQSEQGLKDIYNFIDEL